jgi:hypothetical protein
MGSAAPDPSEYAWHILHTPWHGNRQNPICRLSTHSPKQLIATIHPVEYTQSLNLSKHKELYAVSTGAGAWRHCMHAHKAMEVTGQHAGFHMHTAALALH